MKERELRDLIADVKTGRLSRRAFVQRMIAVGLTAPMAGMMLSQSGVAMAATAFPYKPTKAGGGGAAEAAVLAGRDPAQPAFRRRHQGPGRLPDLLRAAGGMGRRRQSGAVPGRRNSEQGKRRAGRGRPLGDLEAETRRQMARRQAVHRRRRRLQLGICAEPGDRRGLDRAATRTSRSKRSTISPSASSSPSRRRSGPMPLSATTA